MTSVLVFKPGLLGEPERQALLAAGIVAIETPDPAGVRFLETESSMLGGGDLAFAAVDALQVSTGAQQRFADNVLALLKKAREKPAPVPVMPSRDERGRFLKVAP